MTADRESGGRALTAASAAYLDYLPPHVWALHEARPLPSGDVRWTERHLHCLWYDGRLRPASLTTTDGEPLQVLDPGRWNLEAGPDFLGAVLRVGRQAYRLEGDVELHVRPADWVAHGHAADPRYAGVVLHVTFFPGPAPGSLPTGALQATLAAACRLMPGFCFDDIDVSAYPHAMLPLLPRPCAAALGGDPERAERFLRTAGRHRLLTKSQRLAARLRQTRDRYAVFYEEIMAGLGYKQNAGAFRCLARATFGTFSAGEPPETRYARLLGTAGLLPAPDACRDAGACDFARRLWDRYWRLEPDSPMKPIDWRLDHLRPLNHPLRRLAAAAALFSNPRTCLDRLSDLPVERPADWFRAAGRLLSPPHALPFWERRVAFDHQPGDRPIALLGRARLAALLANTVVPLLLAENRLPDDWAEALPPETVSAPMRDMSVRLLGRDFPDVFQERFGLTQQGLLQVRQDFCLRTREGCRDCPLPGRLLS